MSSKGKQIAGKGSYGKRKGGGGDDDKTGGNRKRKNRDVLQFFDDIAWKADDNDFDSDGLSEFDDDFLNDIDFAPKNSSEPGKSEQLPFLPKEEELSGDELERFLEERYRSQSDYVRYAEDDHNNKRSMGGISPAASLEDLPWWKVKCKVGRERHSMFCLMQKFVDLNTLGNKLNVVSAYAADHIKGFVFVEAVRQSDVVEACRQLADVYYSLVTIVPRNEVPHLFTLRRKQGKVSVGMWVRVKSGNYKGDLAQVVAVNDKKATIKLIPRIDLQAMAAKYGGSGSTKRTAVPAPKLISSSELEEFRPLMQHKRDRDTGNMFEVFDGLMLKDGYLYKKVPTDSLRFWDVNPSEEELLKFTSPNNDESDSVEWLSQLYGEQKKKRCSKTEKRSEKGEGSSSNVQEGFEVHDLVLFGKREFGIILGMEKDESYKVLTECSEGPKMLTLQKSNLKIVQLEKNFTALDHRKKTIFVSDTVRILDGPSKGRQGVVKQIYRGVIFLYDESDLDNAYFSAKAPMSEKVKNCDSMCQGKNGDVGSSGFEDMPSSPRSPLSPQNPWQMRENNQDSNRRDKEGMFHVGQTLRIRVGPLKGYLCRAIAVRLSDVTVKLDSQQKVLTVKCEHLTEVREKSYATATSDDPAMSSDKPFDLLGGEGCTNDWMQGVGGSTASNGWGAGGHSNERSSWAAVPSTNSSLQWGTGTDHPTDSDLRKGEGDGAWQSKVDTDHNSSWGAAVDKKNVSSTDEVGGWGKSDGGWGATPAAGASSSLGKPDVSGEDHDRSGKDGESSWGRAKSEDAWGKGKSVDVGDSNNWSNVTDEKNLQDSWSKHKDTGEAGFWDNKGSDALKNKGAWASGSSSWGQEKSRDKQMDKADDSLNKSANDSLGSWGKAMNLQDKEMSDPVDDSWGKAADRRGNPTNSSGSKEWKGSAASGWNNPSNVNDKNSEDTGGWKKDRNSTPCGIDTWNKSTSLREGESSWDKSGGGDICGESRNFERHQGFDGGHGSRGRRGRGGYCGGRDQSGRGRGRSFGGENDQGGGWGNDRGSSKPDRFGSKGWSAQGSVSSDWSQGADKSADGNTQNGQTGERNSWSAGWKSGSSWGQALGTQNAGTGMANDDVGAKPDPQDSWAKVADKVASKNSSYESKGWKSSITVTETQTGGWGNAGGSWDKSREKGKGVAGGTSSWGQALDIQDVGTGMAVDDVVAKDSDPQDSWAKVADKMASKNSSFEAKHWKSSTTVSETQTGGWGNAGKSWDKPGLTYGKDQVDCWDKSKSSYGDGAPSWSKSAGNDTWQQQKSYGDDQGFNGGWGSGGRRGRGGFRGGCDQPGRGRGRSFGQRSEWNAGGQDTEWGKGSSQGAGWGSSSNENNDQSVTWGNVKDGSSWENSSDMNDPGSVRGRGRGRFGGREQSGRGRGRSFGRGQDRPWGNSFGGTIDQGSSRGKDGGSWGDSSQRNNDQSSDWAKDNNNGTSNHGGWGSSADGKRDQGSGWGKAGGSRGNFSGGNNGEADKDNKTGFDSSSAGEHISRSGWGGPSAKNDEKSSGWGGSWGKLPGGNSEQAGGWGNDRGGWGGSSEVKNDRSTGWRGNTSGGSDEQAGGWGKAKAGGNDGGGWGGPSGVKNDKSAGWSGNKSAGNDEQASGRRKAKAGGNDGGGWGGLSGGKNDKSAGWSGNKSGGNDEQASGWSKAKAGGNDGGGWGGPLGGKNDKSAGWSGNKSGGNDEQAGGSDGGGWGGPLGVKNDKSAGWSGHKSVGNDEQASGWGKAKAGGNDGGGWGGPSGGKNDKSAGWSGNKSGGNDEQAGGSEGGGWGGPPGVKNDKSAGWSGHKSVGNDEQASGWGKAKAGGNDGGGWRGPPGAKNDKSAGWSGNKSGGNDEQGGSSDGGGWGGPPGVKKDKSAGWSGNKSGGNEQAGGSDGGGWGGPSGPKNDKSAGWSGNKSGGNDEQAGDSDGGGWGGPPGAKNDKSAGRSGNKSGGNDEQAGGSDGGGWGGPPGAKNDKSAGWSGNKSGGNNEQAGGSDGGGWGGPSGPKNDKSAGWSGNKSGGNNEQAGGSDGCGWGGPSGPKNDKSAGWSGNKSGGNNEQAGGSDGGGWGGPSGPKNDKSAGWSGNKSGGNNEQVGGWGKGKAGDSDGGGWGGPSGVKNDQSAGWCSDKSGSYSKDSGENVEQGGGWGRDMAGDNIGGGWGGSSGVKIEQSAGWSSDKSSICSQASDRNDE